MKKKLTFIILCCLPLLAWGQNIFTAKTVEGVDMTFKVISESEKTCMVGDEQGEGIHSFPTNYSGGITIPSTANGYKVTRVGSWAFNWCGGLTSVSIPETVTSIGVQAFHFAGITEIDFPNCLESIESGAFQCCEGLTSIFVPKSVTNIETQAFEGRNISSITVESGNPVYDSRDNCNGIIKTATNELISGCNNTIIPKTVTRIGSHAIIYCPELTSIEIHTGVTSIDYRAFLGCENLTSVKISSTVESIDGQAFAYCTSLASIEVEEGNPVFDSRDNCNAIIETSTNKMITGCKNTVIPQTVESIGGGAFYGRTSLTTISIPESVTSLEGEAFRCSGLTSITIPQSVVSIDWSSFWECHQLKSVIFLNPTPGNFPETIGKDDDCIVYVPKGSKTAYEAVFPQYIITEVFEVDGINYTVTSPDEMTVEVTGGSYEGDIVIPEKVEFGGNEFSVTSIGYLAFYGCSGLTNITIPEGVTIIDYCAFCWCSGLTSITIPKNVTWIDGSAFYACSDLTSIVVDASNTAYTSANGSNAIIEKATNMLIFGCKNTVIPKYVTSICNYAFTYCNGLTSITIPEIVTSIGDWVFRGCSDLTEVFSMIRKPFAINTECWDDVSTNEIPLYVPKGTKEQYEAMEGWNVFKNIIEKDNGFFVENAVYLNDTLARQGGKTTLSLKMKNTAAIRGFQFDLYLPEGVTVAKNSKGKILGALSADRLPEEDRHTLTLSEQPDGAIRFLCSSQYYDDLFTGNDGEIATLQVNIAEGMADGDYLVQLKDIKLTESDIEKYYETDLLRSYLNVNLYVIGDINRDKKVDVSDYTGVANHIHGITPQNFFVNAADVDDDGIIDVSDYTGIANIIHTGNIYGISASRAMSAGPKRVNTDVSDNDNVIYVEPFAAAPGTQTTISFKMKNTAEIRGFQFDLYLPEGVTVVKSAKGRIQGALNTGRLPEDDEHDLTFSEQADGAIRFLCSSQYPETFTGNDGEIATLQIKVAENMAYGNYPVLMKNVKLTETDIRNFYVTEEVETTMSVLLKGDVNGDGFVNAADVTALANYIIGRGILANEPAAYVNDDNKIDIADVAALIELVK